MNAVIPPLLDTVRRLADECLAPPSSQLNSEWADANVVLDERQTPWPGPYDSSITPWARTVMDFPHDDRYDKLFIGKSSQGGLTEACLNIIRRKPLNDPGPVIYAIDTENEVRKISDIRLRPTIEQLGGHALTGEKDDLALMTIKLRNMIIYLGGGGSPALYENKFASLIILDEVENHKLNREASRDASTIGLAEERMKLVPGAKMIVLGKFGLHGGLLHSEWMDGTREFFEVPCQGCGAFQSLRIRGLDFAKHKDLAGGWDKRGVIEDTGYLCQGGVDGVTGAKLPPCGYRHSWHEHLPQMTRAGRWGAPTNAKPTPRVRSIQISDLYSPAEKVSWGNLAMGLINSKGNPGERRKLFNHNFGLPWKEREQKVEAEEILALRGGLKDHRTGTVSGPLWRMGWDPTRRVCPIPDPAVVLCCFDRQDACDKFVTAAFRATGEMYVIDYGEEMSGGGGIESAYLRRYQVLGAKDEDGEPVEMEIEPYGGLVDSGFDTKKTYALCEAIQMLGKQVFPSMGMPSSQTSGRLWVQRSIAQFGDAVRYDYLDYNLKYELYANRIKRRGAPRIYFPADIADHPQLLAELTAERLETRPVGRRMVTKWETHGRQNDYGDCLKELLLCWDILAPSLLVN